MRVKSPKVLVRVLLFGLLLGASSSAYADTVVITSFNFSNVQFNPATGTAVFTPTGAGTRSLATNSLGENQDISSNTFPVSQTTAVVTFANASGSASATNLTANATSFVSVGGCTCSASSFGLAVFSGTLVILGGEGNVDVTFSMMPFATGQVMTDQFGASAEAEVFWNFLLNGVSVLSNDQMLIGVNGPNQTGQFQLGPGAVSRTFSLQFGAVNTIELRIGANGFANEVNAVPEPASMLLLVSGLGFMAGVLKKRLKTVER